MSFCILLPLRCVSFEEQLTEEPEVVHTANLVIKLRVDNEVEVIIDLLNLSEVLVLHASTSRALRAILRWVGEQDLVDDDVVNVDLLLGQLDSKALGLVHTEELWNTDGYESGLICVLELLVDFLDFSLHAINAIKESLLCLFSRRCTRLSTLTHHSLNLGKHASEFIFKFDQLDETFFENIWEVEQAKSVTSWCCVENDQAEVVLVE